MPGIVSPFPWPAQHPKGEYYMGSSYIPYRDAEALGWMQNFAAKLSSSSAIYLVSGADAANVSGLVTDFAEAMAVLTDPSRRTRTSVSDKSYARTAAEEICRRFAMQIKQNGGISDQDKIAIGVRPITTSRQANYVPESSPVLNLVGATPGSHTVRFTDSMMPELKGKPHGAFQIQLFRAIADAEVESPAEAPFYGAFTRNPVGVAFDAADDGKVATYFARWAGRRGDVGPWSNGVSMRIAA